MSPPPKHQRACGVGACTKGKEGLGDKVLSAGFYRVRGRTAGLRAEERGLQGSDVAFVSENQLPADLEPGWEFPPLCLSTLTALLGDSAQLPPEPTPEPAPWSSCDMEKAAQKLRQKCDHRRKRTSASLL